MNKTIWKFPIRTIDLQFITIPQDFEILSVHTQNGNPCIWAKVIPDNKSRKLTIRVFGTGHPIEEDSQLVFIGTYLIHQDSLVFHVFYER